MPLLVGTENRPAGSPPTRNGMVCVLTAAVLLCVCAHTIHGIPLRPKMSDVVLACAKPSPVKKASFTYVSHLADISPTCTPSESTTLEKMLREYLSMKFTSLDPDADPKIKVELYGFWFEEQSTGDDSGKCALLFGRDRTTFTAANLHLVYQITKAGSTVEKTVRVSSDFPIPKIERVPGLLSPRNEREPIPDKTSEDLGRAELVNSANNKAIILLNLFLEANQL